jgi:hypothetical protein
VNAALIDDMSRDRATSTAGPEPAFSPNDLCPWLRRNRVRSGNGTTPCVCHFQLLHCEPISGRGAGRRHRAGVPGRNESKGAGVAGTRATPTSCGITRDASMPGESRNWRWSTDRSRSLATAIGSGGGGVLGPGGDGPAEGPVCRLRGVLPSISRTCFPASSTNQTWSGDRYTEVPGTRHHVRYATSPSDASSDSLRTSSAFQPRIKSRPTRKLQVFRNSLSANARVRSF